MTKQDRFVICVCSISLIFSIMMIITFNQERNYVESRSIDEIKNTMLIQSTINTDTVDGNVIFAIEKVENSQNDSLLVSGYFYIKDLTYQFDNYGLEWHGEAVYNNYQLCLIDGDTIYIFPTKLLERVDISNETDDIFYGKCGFVSCINQEYSDKYYSSNLGILTKNPSGGETLYDFGQQQ